mgnify:FL=1
MVNYSKKPPRGSMPQPDHIFISINGDAKTSMTVTWRTSIDVTSGYALCRKDGTDEYMRYEADTDVFESDIDISNMFWARMTNLEPGTKYFYSVGNDEFRSDEFYFTTEEENAESFKFICVSDQQSGEPHDLPDYSSFNEFLNKVLAENPDTKFILTGGDNTDCGQHEVQWNGAFSGLKGIVEHIPFMMTLGNHDNRGFEDYRNGIGRYYSEPAEFFGKQFKGSYPYNGPDGWKTENYSFDYGNAHFNVLGVNGPEDVNEWLKIDVPASDKIWKFGSYHFPIYYTGPELANDDAYPMMREGVELLDVIFSGHEHNFSRSFPIKNESIFDKPSQGTVHYELGNSNYNPPGTATVKKVWHAAYYPQTERVAAVAIVEVFKDRVELTTKLNDGRIVDSCVIDKEKDEIRPYALAPFYRRPRIFYKGTDLGLGQRELFPEQKDGIWYAPLSVMFNAICAEVIKEKGKVTLEIYGKRATFTENSDVAMTDDGEVKLVAPVYRGNRGQLYIPVESVVSCFDMKWNYAEKNNFISIEHVSEDIPYTEQP